MERTTDKHVPILTDEPVTVRDSWDILETPRTSSSETDGATDKSQHHCYVKEETHKKRGRQHRHQRDHHTHSNYALESEQQGSSRRNNSRNNQYRCQTSKPRTQSAHREDKKYDYNNYSYYSSEPQTPKIIPRRYRRLGLRNHDEMLQEQFAQLRHLLHDSENMNREELGRQHIAQTTNMIGKYLISAWLM